MFLVNQKLLPKKKKKKKSGNQTYLCSWPHIQNPFVSPECLGSGLSLSRGRLGDISSSLVYLLAYKAEYTLEFGINYFGCSICVSCFIPSLVTCHACYIIADLKHKTRSSLERTVSFWKVENWQEKSLLLSEAIAGADAECILCKDSEAEAIEREKLI